MKNNDTTTEAHDLLHAHRELMKQVRALHDVLQLGQQADPTDLKKLLDELRAEINEHFAFEEEGGYLSEVLQRNPQEERLVHELEAQHGDLSRSLDAIIAEFAGAQTVDDETARKINEWMDQLRYHESQENKLVQQTFNLVSGGGD